MLREHLLRVLWIDCPYRVRIGDRHRRPHAQEVHVLVDECLRIGLVERPQHLVERRACDRIVLRDGEKRIALRDDNAAARSARRGARGNKKAHLQRPRAACGHDIEQDIDNRLIDRLRGSHHQCAR